eukprot:Pompholyxophrys_punicea_v1_NODE_494_length_1844_cov_14.574064.p3 type:complete len:145 gc:universal NODE_494_length_1844_cov_14.574064:303-737(+)
MKEKGAENKAPGEDGIYGWMLVKGGVAMRRALWKLVQVVWEKEEIAEKWELARVVMLWKKKGERERFESWRPVSLMSVVAKVVARVMGNRLREGVKISERQIGFMSGRSVREGMLRVRAWLERREGHVVFVDIKSAFDKVFCRV